MAEIRVDHVTFRYVTGKQPALRDVTLNIPEGQVVLLAGPSGCGKTTLGYAIAGLLPERVAGRMNGAVYHGAQRLTGTPLHEVARHVGLVFQNPESQLLQYDVSSEVAFGPENLNLPHDEIVARVKRSMVMTGVEGFQFQALNTLSGGQKQRVAIAAALAMQPSVLVLDEPTADLDPVGTQEVLQVIRSLNRQYHMTVILIEHKIDEVIGWTDRVVLMEDGRVALDADPRSAFEDVSRWHRLNVAVPQMVHLSQAMPEVFGADVAITVTEALDALKGSGFGTSRIPVPSPIAPTDPPGEPPILEWDHVSLAYQRQQVLRDVSLAVYPQEWVALVGANGSGKTSLAGLAMGFMAPTAGTVRWQGERVRSGNVARQASQLGYLFQSPDTMLFGETVERELMFSATFGSLERRQQARPVEELARLADLQDRLDSNPFQLSYGQRQRLAIGTLLGTNPLALVLDEPTTGQDQGHATLLLAFLQQIRREHGVTLLMISHDMRAVAQYATRVAVLSPEGRIVLDGPPDRVFAQREILQTAHVVPPPVADLHARLVGEPIPRVALTVSEFVRVLGGDDQEREGE